MITAERLIQLAGGAERVCAFIDVGAFRGDFSVDAANASPGVVFVGVEPLPRLAEELRLRTRDLANYVVVEAAAGPRAGVATLHVPSSGRYNFSSLLPMDEERTSYREVELDQEVAVRVERLEDIVRVVDRPGRLAIKIDTQGTDIAVLESLGAELGRVGAGMLEATVRQRTAYYVDSPTRAESVRALRRTGFEVVGIYPEHPENVDQNLLFVQRTLLGRRWLLWRAAYPFLVCATWAGYIVVRLRVRLALRTRLRRLIARDS